MTINKSKGFTIIELLVVVAIIAVLAAIVLVNVTGYINQGKNAAIKGNLSTVLTNAAVWFDTNGSYAVGATSATSFLLSSGYTAPATAAESANGAVTLTSAYNVATPASGTPATAWCACSVIRATSAESGTFCVDSSGYKKVSATVCATRCNQATVLGQCID